MNTKKIANSVLHTKASDELQKQVEQELKLEDGTKSIASLLEEHEVTQAHRIF